MTRWTTRSITVSIATCLALGVAAGCARSDSSVRLVRPAGAEESGAARVTTLATTRGRPHSFGGPHVCVSAAGSVVIEAVELSGGNGGLTLTRFAAKAGRAPGEPSRTGSARGRLESLGFDPTPPVKVSTLCYGGNPDDSYDASQHLTELAIEVQRDRQGSGSSDGLTVRYSDGRQQRKLDIPFGVTLCAMGDRSTPDCK